MTKFATLAALAMAFSVPAGAAERRPNFLVILGDNLGKDWFGARWLFSSKPNDPPGKPVGFNATIT